MKLCQSVLIALLVFFTCTSYGEDIELYVGDTKIQVGTKPQVLVIFDNSGSMGTSLDTVAGYDASIEYPVVSQFDNSLNENFIYFTVGTGVDEEIPRTDKNSDTKRFNSPVNGCDTAREALDKYGIYSGFIREHKYKGNTGSWVQLQENSGANTIAALDCLDDIVAENGDNTDMVLKIGGTTYDSASDPILQGLPVNGASKNAKNFYTGKKTGHSESEIESALDAFKGGEVITLYHPNYLRWYHAVNKVVVSSTRLQVAKDAMTSVINTTPIVDFSLMIFNLDYKGENKRDGGRIISAFGETRANIVTEINSIDAETNTPLCETLYEASRYFSGYSVMFGDDDTDCSSNDCGFKYTGNTPSADTSIILNNNYISPFKQGCASNVYVILVTDGVPTVDLASDDEISTLIATKTDPENESTPQSPYSDDSLSSDSYLPNLAHWINNNDLNLNVSGKQTASLYTIGFSEGADDAAPLLKYAAEQGGGKYYPANNAIELASALSATLSEILQVNTTFTSPSVASNNFDRTRSLESVYYAMFYPETGARWAGNIKKLKVVGDVIVDKNSASAIGTDGNIKDNASTFWLKPTDNDGKPDGNEVKVGGVNMQLAKLTSRKVISDIGSLTFTKANAVTKAGGDDELATYMNTTVDELDNLFNWAKGVDVDDEDADSNVTELRSDIMGDPLHSKPLAISYGDGDVRVLVGTNAGSVHMFKDSGDTVSEEWSFIPYELYPNLAALRDNTAGEKVYGMDGSPIIYFKDGNGNRIVDGAEKVWAFIGMRRGGSAYYAFDISVPSDPSLLWSSELSSSDPGFSEMGQSWSKPKIAFINVSGYKNKPLLVIGAGYDPNKDSGTKSDDSQGRGIFIVDAETKTLVWSFTPAATGGKNTQFKSATGNIIGDSIPGDVALLDSNFDGFIDRMYTADTGGNVWRIDMPGSDPVSSESPWTVIKLAELGSTSTANDRRFFYQPEVARTLFSKVSESTVIVDGESTTTKVRTETPYEAVLIGSGNRSHPTYKTTSNALYMIRDENTVTRSFNKSEDVPDVITVDKLMDITTDPFAGVLSDKDAFVDLEASLASFSGWKFGLGGAEKSLSKATVVGGIAYFTTFSPSEANDLENCVLDGGGGSLYAFHLHYGSKIYDTLTLDLGQRVPDAPQTYFADTGLKLITPTEGGITELTQISYDPIPRTCSDGSISLTGCAPPPCPEGQDCSPPPMTSDCAVGEVCLGTQRTYIYRQDVNSGY